MRKISDEVKEQLLKEKNVCARKGSDCRGRISWEHALIVAGRQLDEAWAIIKLCTYHHAIEEHMDGGDLNKEINLHIALNRASDLELESISKAIDYKRERERLNKKYDNSNG